MMPKLSNRMKCIADMVTPGKRVADIGCDHAFISIYLAKEGISLGGLAMDIAAGPLENAKNNIEMYGVADKVKTRISNGMDALEQGECDAAIISGMGGPLIIDILNRGILKLSEGYELILSPQSEIEEVRHFLRTSGFQIVDEEMMIEDGKYYNIIKTVFLGNATDDLEENTNILYDRYGKLLIQKKSPVLLRYSEERIEKLEGIYCKLSKETGDSIIDRMAEINSEVDELAKVIELIKN